MFFESNNTFMSKFKYKFFFEKTKFKYKLSILNENTLEESWHIRFSRLSLILYLFIILALIFVINFFLIIKTPLKTFVPGYLDMEIRPQLIDETLRTDSLLREAQKTDEYLLCIKELISGNIKLDDNDTKDSLWEKTKVVEFSEKSKREAAYCEKFESEEKYKLSVGKTESNEEQFIFNSPAHGVIIKKYQPNNKNHYGVDILVSANESIRCVAEGHIISVQYTLDDGYVIMIQHANNFISIYKRNSMSLKKIGDHVSAGESIAIASNLLDKKDGEKIFLHFELWRDGKPQNPEKYILF